MEIAGYSWQFLTTSPFEKPGCATSAAEFEVEGVGGAEVVGGGEIMDGGVVGYCVLGEGKELFHDWGV